MKQLVRIISGECANLCGYVDISIKNDDNTYTVYSPHENDKWELKKKKEELEIFE